MALAQLVCYIWLVYEVYESEEIRNKKVMNFRIALYNPVIRFVRYRHTPPGIKLKKWKRPNYSHHSNPGIQKRLEMLEIGDTSEADSNDIEDTEFDFMEANKMHDLHESEEEKTSHVQQLKMVGNKYFKQDPSPSLLTWAEKQQIQHLHSSDADKWTVQKLAKSFPASETTIKKVLKSKWQPRDAARVLKHDLTVQNNWQLFQSGKLEVDPELKSHLLQFVHRSVQPPDTTGLFLDSRPRPRPKKSEFGSIIESYKSLRSKETSKVNAKDTTVLHRAWDTPAVPKDDSFLLRGGESYMSQSSITLERYRGHVASSIQRGRSASVNTKLMLTRHNKPEDCAACTETVQSTELDRPVTAATDETSYYKNAPPQRIRVPQEKWRKGCTFKLGDCYYDDDGVFLYRVPGMK